MDYFIYGLADYVANLRYEDLPVRAKEVAKQAILDAYGNMVCGRTVKQALSLRRQSH
jgi:2-methylcitrate dehydratase PrpD